MPAFKAKKYTLENMIRKASGVVGGRSDLEILKSYKFTVDGSNLRCVATDMELTVLASSNGIEPIESGSIVIDASKLKEIVASLTEEDLITVKTVGPKRASITTEFAKWEIVVEDPDAYPAIPDPGSATFSKVDRGELMAALLKVSPACATDGLRPSLMVVDVTTDRMRATDGVRFHSVEMTMPMEFQLPIGAVGELLRFLRLAIGDQIGIAMRDDALLFEVDDDVLCAASVVTQFPDMKNIIASIQDNKRVLAVEKAALIAAIQRVRINADVDTKQVSMCLASTGIVVSAANRFGETSEHAIVGDWQYPTSTIVLNANHFIDALKAHERPAITLAIGEGEVTPVAILGDRGVVTIIRQLRI